MFNLMNGIDGFPNPFDISATVPEVASRTSGSNQRNRDLIVPPVLVVAAFVTGCDLTQVLPGLTVNPPLVVENLDQLQEGTILQFQSTADISGSNLFCHFVVGGQATTVGIAPAQQCPFPGGLTG